VRTPCRQDDDAVVGGPLKEAAQVLAVRLERPAAVAGKERDRGKLRSSTSNSTPGARSVVAAD
jgi:hypothetical protein